MGTERVHHISRVNTLSLRLDAQLLNIMYSLKINDKYKKDSTRVTRNIDRFVIKTEIVHKDIHAK